MQYVINVNAVLLKLGVSVDFPFLRWEEVCCDIRVLLHLTGVENTIFSHHAFKLNV